ncbi:DNA polymerase Y family protein [Sinomicrobium soli]|uniref:DNA polymerase Y family protein n=1 Tax=Sinomicrobium sp. N-1-3-6 TaxID=2219864 RepID=UPI000DCCFC26|nr:DNA polymerase IV [Sinomicrobium sp. N-1-3-6]RAV28672.1 DNA polymerase IV [Sinomicrobium sp. N-1-3-6]
MNRTILHLDLDTFFVSVERLLDSRLQGRPILVGGLSDRGVVAACSYEARTCGVHSGMPMKMARELCKEAIVIKGDASVYTRYSETVTRIIRENVPLFEKASIDEFYADLSGMDRFFGTYRYASELRRRIIRETGLPISFGLSVNKVVSKVATNEAKPNNQRLIDPGREKTFLAPLSVRKLPMIGDSTYLTLRNLGIRRMSNLQEMPGEVLYRVLGRNGLTIRDRANGIDMTPVIPFSERKSISTERTFDRDTIDVQRLRTILAAMTENLAFQLRRGGKLTACVSVTIRYSDFQTYSKQLKIPYTSADHVLIPRVTDLFYRLYDRRMLIRLIGVKFSHLVHGNYQIDLFEDTEETIRLYEAMDKIRLRYGDRSVTRASALGVKTIGRMTNPFNGQPPIILAHRKQ